MIAVGWVEERNPTATMVVLGFARLNPTYGNMSLPEILSVKQPLHPTHHRYANPRT